MKKIVLLIAIALFGITAVGSMPSEDFAVYAQKKGKEKKDPPGPPVVKDKEPKDKGGNDRSKDRPKRDRKPPDDE